MIIMEDLKTLKDFGCDCGHEEECPPSRILIDRNKLKEEAIKWIKGLGCYNSKGFAELDYDGELKNSDYISDDLVSILNKECDVWFSGNTWLELGATVILMKFFNITKEDLE